MTRMYFDPSIRTGVIILTNGEKARPLQQIERELFTYAENCLNLKKPFQEQ